MNTSEFKERFIEKIKEAGFNKKGPYFYKRFPELIQVIYLQKSSYSNGYYVSVGYVIRSLEPTLDNPRDVDGHIRTRFSHILTGKPSDFFDLDSIPANKDDIFRECLVNNITDLLTSVSTLDSLRELLRKKPVLLYQTTIKAKELLGLE